MSSNDASTPELPWRLRPGEDAWAQLAPEARRALLEPLAGAAAGVRPSYSHVAEPLARALGAAGFLTRERGPTGVELVLDPLAVPFAHWLREVHERALLASDEGLEAWIARLLPEPVAVLSLAQSVAAHAGLPPPIRDPLGFLAGAARSPSWPTWATRRRGPAESALLELVGQERGRTGARTLARLVPRLGRQEVDRVRERLLARLVLFHDLDPRTLELEIGFLAPAREAFAPTPEPAPLVPLAAPPEAFARPVFQGDLAALLLELARSPVKVKVTKGQRALRASEVDRLYGKAQTRLLAALEPVPAWLESLGYLAPRRLELALATAVARALVHTREGELSLSESGRTFLAKPRPERLAVFPQPSAPWKARLDETFYGVAASSILHGESRDRASLLEASPADRAALRAAVARAFEPLELGCFFDLDAFARNACARGQAPLLRGAEPERVTATLGLRAIPPERAELEQASRQLLRHLVAGPLAHVGGVALAPLGSGKRTGGFAFALTALGRVYLGLDQALAPSAPEDAPPDVIVQPNFDVVLLGTSSGPEPAALAELLLVAEPASGGAGDPARTLKITRASVRAAVAAGLDADSILALLARFSKTGVPGNVAHAVRDWASAVRRASLTLGPVLALPDEETLERVRAALGEHARPLAHALWVPGLKPGELRRRLERLGLILET